MNDIKEECERAMNEVEMKANENQTLGQQVRFQHTERTLNLSSIPSSHYGKVWMITTA